MSCIGQLTVIRPGAQVSINNTLTGHVSAVMIESSGAISYRVSWWSDATRNSCWVDCFEVDEAEEPKRLSVSFSGDRPG